MNIEDAAKVIYKMMKCDNNEEDCANKSCNKCEYFTHRTEEKDARKTLAEYFLKEKYIKVSYDRTGDETEDVKDGGMCETCRYYDSKTYWCSQCNDTTYSPNCSSYQVKEERK